MDFPSTKFFVKGSDFIKILMLCLGPGLFSSHIHACDPCMSCQAEPRPIILSQRDRVWVQPWLYSIGFLLV